MSTLTCTAASQDTDGGRPAERLISGPLALVFLSTFGALAGFYLLLSVTPRYAAAAGSGSAGAGLVTGVLLLGTVAAELAAPVLMKRFTHRTLLVAGAVLLGAPTLALLARGSMAVIVTVSVIRGFGFGLSTVLGGALTAMLLPPQRRGEGLGLYGVVDTVPGVVALPAGLWLAGHYGMPLVVVLTAAAALVPLVAFPWLPAAAGRGADDHGAAGDRPADRGPADRGPAERGAAERGAAEAPTEHPVGLLDGLRHAGQLRPSLIFATSTVAAGVVVSFLPLASGVSSNVAAAGLLAQALAATLGTWWAGRYGDRRGHARLLAPGLAIASLGMTAMIWPALPAAVIVGMCLFGTGFGILQNATFVMMIDRMPASGLGTASALWSLAYDAGYGAGPAVFGLAVSHTGYPAAFALTGALMLAALPAARRERRTIRLVAGAPSARM
jgi:predicted MFS family arabinose efflux permease